MSADVETMFYTRTTPWHGLGVNVEEAPTSEDALVAAGLDWRVIQKDIRTSDGITVPGFKANVRNIDSAEYYPIQTHIVLTGGKNADVFKSVLEKS